MLPMQRMIVENVNFVSVQVRRDKRLVFSLNNILYNMKQYILS